MEKPFSKAILSKLSSSKQIRYSRRYRIHYAMTDVKLGNTAGVSVLLSA